MITSCSFNAGYGDELVMFWISMIGITFVLGVINALR